MTTTPPSPNQQPPKPTPAAPAPTGRIIVIQGVKKDADAEPERSLIENTASVLGRLGSKLKELSARAQAAKPPSEAARSLQQGASAASDRSVEAIAPPAAKRAETAEPAPPAAPDTADSAEVSEPRAGPKAETAPPVAQRTTAKLTMAVDRLELRVGPGTATRANQVLVRKGLRNAKIEGDQLAFECPSNRVALTLKALLEGHIEIYQLARTTVEGPKSD